MVDPLDHLAQAHLGVVLAGLLDQLVDQLLAVHLGEAGDVEDVLLGVDRGNLAAELLEALDDPDAGIAMAAVVGGGKAGRAAADDGDVGDLLCAHGRDLHALPASLDPNLTRRVTRCVASRVAPKPPGAGTGLRDLSCATGASGRTRNERPSGVCNWPGRARAAAMRLRGNCHGQRHGPLTPGANYWRPTPVPSRGKSVTRATRRWRVV